MKHLLLFFLFTCSLKSFSQEKPEKMYLWPDGKYSVLDPGPWPISQPDTLRALMLVTLSHKFHGVAHARMGFVVVQPGRKTVYLDCWKRPLKFPAMGWGYEVVYKTEIK